MLADGGAVAGLTFSHVLIFSAVVLGAIGRRAFVLLIPAARAITTFSDFDELSEAVSLWNEDNATALDTYGHISFWNVSLVTRMNGLFSGKTNINVDLIPRHAPSTVLGCGAWIAEKKK